MLMAALVPFDAEKPRDGNKVHEKHDACLTSLNEHHEMN